MSGDHTSTSGTLTVALSGTGAQPAAPPAGPLPATGSGDSSVRVVIGAAALVAAGFIAVWLSRRRPA